MSGVQTRLAVDIGGTFTDVALDVGGQLFTSKVLTTAAAPEEGVLQAVAEILPRAGVAPADVGFIVHGTTLATNTIIERKGARTALLVTEGFRDSVEMGYEHRFEQYDIQIEKPKPLVPRYLRLPITERVSAQGDVLIPLDERSIDEVLAPLDAAGIESVAIALIHSYANPSHERRVAELLRQARPDLWLTLSSEVCPEIREYERMSTASANAYVRPLMAKYLQNLQASFSEQGFQCPLYLMMSGGGLTTIDTAVRFPIRLVESGPAGGAILASQIAKECGLDQVISYDMGGTTAKICLIDDGKPQNARTFEIDRQYRFVKGSGLPVRIPVIEMVEIGAGGGSIAHVDRLGRVLVGPESAGSEPGPACYNRGGEGATVTDADVLLGRIDPDGFAGGNVQLDKSKAETAVAAALGGPLNVSDAMAALALSEVVDENMANAARVHAVEQGKDTRSRALVAFGGAAPLHACRMAEKLGISSIIVPTGAGVGSAIGFLQAPVSYEVVRSHYMRLDHFDPDSLNTMLQDMQQEARDIVEAGAAGAPLEETRLAYMRYVGQGHEIVVDIPLRDLEAEDATRLKEAFDIAYASHFGRTIPSMDVEILNWSITVTTAAETIEHTKRPDPEPGADADGERNLLNIATADFDAVPVYARQKLHPGMRLNGPAVITEEQTTTVVSAGFDVEVNALGYLQLTRRMAEGDAA